MAEKDKKYYWLKLKRDFFKRHDIQIIEDMHNGKDYILFYVKLLCESVDHNGELRFNEEIPYNDEMLATITRTNIDIVRSAINIFTKLQMMEMLDDGTIYMREVQKMLGGETYWAERTRVYRERQKQKSLTMSNQSQICQGKSIDIDLEKDLDKEIEEECNTPTPFEAFVEKYSISCDNYNAVISEIDFDLLDKAFSESKWLQANMTCLSVICKQYNKIVGGAFKDFTKPKETAEQLSDIDFLIKKGFSEEWVMALTDEERREKRKKLEN